MTYSYYNDTRIDAIIPVPLAPSISADISIFGQVFRNIGVVRNTGSELTLNTQVVQTRAFAWTVGGNLSTNTNRVVRLNPGQRAIINGDRRVQAGYPLWGTWMKSIQTFADENGDHIIASNEIRYRDSAVYVGRPDPKYHAAFHTGVTLLSGRLSINATFESQQGMTQDNEVALSSGSFYLLPNVPGATFATQAGVVAGQNGVSHIGVIQTVDVFRFSDLSINYVLPTTLTRRFRVPTASLALQGSNLGLHTNYRGKDPSVNAFATSGTTGDRMVDAGQVPQPRLWRLMLSLGN
jgi:hypothetical protein